MHGTVVSAMADIFYCPICYMRKVHKIQLEWDEEPHSYDEPIPTCSECKRPRSATLRVDKNGAFLNIKTVVKNIDDYHFTQRQEVWSKTNG